MPNFDQFVSTVRRHGIAKSSHFFCDIQPPKFMTQTALPELIEMIPFYVESVNFPEIALATETVKDNGLNREVVYDKLYGTVTMSFTCDQNMVIKKFFDDWVGSAVLKKGGVFMYPSEYMAPTITIHQVDSQTNSVYMVFLDGAFPKVVDDVMVSSNGREQLTFRVQWTFESWDSVQVPFNDPSVTVDKNARSNVRNLMNIINMIRTGANKDALRSAAINVGTRKIMDIIGKTGTDAKVSGAVNDILGKTGIGTAIGALKGIIL
jgi:hypothetical protein